MPNRLLKAALVVGLVFLGALFWARQRDSFHRVWFSVQHPEGAASCVAVLPKTQPWPLPVVIYFHGSGGGVLGSGNDFRNIAEMGIAAVSIDYCQTNETQFEAELSALLDHVSVTLRGPEDLKMSCYFCKAHVRFPPHANIFFESDLFTYNPVGRL